MSQIRGRFQRATGKDAAGYTASIPFDWRLYPYDIAGSIAHAGMLGKQGIISAEEAKTIIGGLTSIKKDIDRGEFEFKIELEDIHMNIEAGLIEKVGEVGGKLHTARSRNDQIALDMRLFVRKAIVDTLHGIREFQRAIIEVADANKDVAVPGYTHTRRAQPVLLAHYFLAYFEMFERDIERFDDCLKRTDTMPLGSGALAGVAYDIDREFVAKELGFSGVTRNSMDAVADRDFVLEYESAASICMMHISRLAQEMVLWSSDEFNYVELDDAYCTGSSLMPQKKNPDVAELARGKTGRVYGHLMALLTTMKGLPLTYNLDLQEDKEALFDTVDTLLTTLEVFAGMLRTMQVKAENMAKAAGGDYILATDLADYLVKKGTAFRTAHNIVGRLVLYAIGKGKLFNELSLAEYKKFSPLFGKDVFSITVASSLAARNITGGTAPEQVTRALTRARKMIEGTRRNKA